MRALIPAILVTSLSACSLFSGSPDDTTASAQQVDQQSLNCSINGLVFQDLARLRDGGQPIDAARNRIDTQYQGLAASLAQRTAVDLALAQRNDSAKFVYAHKALQPVTLRYFGDAICLAHTAAGDPKLSAMFAKAAEGCQKQNSPQAAESQLKQCIFTAIPSAPTH